MKFFLTLLFSIALLNLTIAENIPYSFDYQIDMEDEVKYTDTTSWKNYKRLKTTLINSKDRNYVGMVLYDKDTLDTELTIIDFKNSKNYIIYPNDKKKEIVVVKHQENNQKNITQQKADTTYIKRTRLIKKIDSYTCEQLFLSDADFTYEVWFTGDITDAPINAFYAVDIYGILPLSYKGCPVSFKYKSKDLEINKNLVSTKKTTYRIVLNANKLLRFENILKDIPTPEKNE